MNIDRRRDRDRGQALMEMSVAVLVLFFTVITIIEFGRAFMITNMLTQAARAGARVAAVLPNSSRSGNGTTRCITTSTGICSTVKGNMRNVMSQSDVDGFGITISQTCNTGTPVVKVAITGSVNYIFYGASFGVNRSVTFEDEGGPQGGVCAACANVTC